MVKLKPNADKLIKAWLDSLEEVAPKECADKCRTAGHFSINWCLENLPKLLEATHSNWDGYGRIIINDDFTRPVAIVEVEND